MAELPVSGPGPAIPQEEDEPPAIFIRNLAELVEKDSDDEVDDDAEVIGVTTCYPPSATHGTLERAGKKLSTWFNCYKRKIGRNPRNGSGKSPDVSLPASPPQASSTPLISSVYSKATQTTRSLSKMMVTNDSRSEQRIPVVQATSNAPNHGGAPVKPTVSRCVQAPSPACVYHDSGSLQIRNVAPAVMGIRPPPTVRPMTYPSLVVRVRPSLVPKQPLVEESSRRNLDDLVKQVVAFDLRSLIDWLRQTGLVKVNQTCPVHNWPLNTTPGRSDPPAVLTGRCCPGRAFSVYRHSIFDRTNLNPTTVVKLIYYWAVQSEAKHVIEWVKIPNTQLKAFYSLMRGVCTAWLHEHCPPLGGQGSVVDVGIVTLSSTAKTSQGDKPIRVEILGMLDKVSKRIRLKVINVLLENLNNCPEITRKGIRDFQILFALAHTVDKGSVLVLDKIINPQLLRSIGFVHADIITEESKGFWNSNTVMAYLKTTVPASFSTTLSALSKPRIQEFLDELSWREMHASTSLNCFTNIVAHLKMITQSHRNTDGVIKFLAQISNNPFIDWSVTKRYARSVNAVFPPVLRKHPGIRECIQHLSKTSFTPSPPNLAEALPAPVSSPAKRIKLTDITSENSYRLHLTSNPKVPTLQTYYNGSVRKRRTDLKPTGTVKRRKNGSSASTTDNEDMLRSPYPVKVLETMNATCVECSQGIGTAGHFVGRLCCRHCLFVTSCQAAMNAHTDTKHKGKKEVFKILGPVMVGKRDQGGFTCKCGFISVNSTATAQHLVTCEKKTVFLSKPDTHHETQYAVKILKI